jgi:hypothetical protein
VDHQPWRNISQRPHRGPDQGLVASTAVNKNTNRIQLRWHATRNKESNKFTEVQYKYEVT